MATQVQTRRGTTAEHSTFTGAVGELTVDTDKDTAVVHDGSTAGGAPLLREDGSNSALALGSAASPSLKFTGDTNTGIYSPGADQVAISSNSSERIRIGANGEIGIGGANYGTSGQVLTSGGSGAAPSWTTLTVNTDKIEEGNSSAEVIDTGSDGRFVVTTEGSERLRVDSSGRLGLGSSSPATDLFVEGNSTSRVEIRIKNNNSTGANKYIGMFAGGTSAPVSSWNNAGVVESAVGGNLVLSGYDSGILFQTGNNRDTRAVIDSSGRLGIGTTLPTDTNGFGNALDVNGTAGSALYVRTNGSATNFGMFGHSGTTAYVINQSNGPLTMWTNGSEKARIDSSGRLLVGTSSARSNVQFAGSSYTPTTQFETAVAAYDNGLSLINNSTGGQPSNIWIGASRGSSIGSNTLASNQTLGNINFVGADGSNLIHGARIHADTDGTTGSGDLPTRLVFSTTADGASSPTERMRLDRDGAILSFTSAAQDCHLIGSAAGAGTSNKFILGRHSATSVSNGTTTFTVTTNGNVLNTNNSYGSLSDIKLKENIVAASSQWSDIKGIEVVNYNFKEETGHQTHKQLGVIAQQAETVSPGLVNTDADGLKSVNYSVLYMKAVKALQEAMERIEVLEAKVNTLEGN